MHILLVNDDGIQSEALAQLCRSCAARGHQVTVCAPAGQQSAKSHCFTIFSPVIVKEQTMEGAEKAWAVEGTPVDCTRLGLMALCEEPVDMVISGINYGYNAGLATYVSGTVGAAREAAFQLKPSMAVSMAEDTTRETMLFFADWIVTAAERLIRYANRPQLSVCNLNIPNVPVHELQPPVMCCLSRNIYHDHYERRVNPHGQIYFWVSPEEPDNTPTPGSDVDMLRQGHITCTFLTPEPEDQHQFDDFWEDF